MVGVMPAEAGLGVGPKTKGGRRARACRTVPKAVFVKSDRSGISVEVVAVLLAKSPERSPAPPRTTVKGRQEVYRCRLRCYHRVEVRVPGAFDVRAAPASMPLLLVSMEGVAKTLMGK